MHMESCGSTEYAHNCLTCGKGYHMKQVLMEHLNSKHQPVPPVEDRTCPQCGEVFNLVKTMREHLAVHRGPYPCPVEDCPKMFSLPKCHTGICGRSMGMMPVISNVPGHLKVDEVTCNIFIWLLVVVTVESIFSFP